MTSARAFIAVAGLIFGLIIAAHVARVAVEGAGLLREPGFVVTSLIALGLAIWSVWLLRQGSRRS